MKKKIIIGLVALFSSSAMAASAPTDNNFRKAEDAVEYRQSAFSLIAYNFGNISAMLKGKKPYDPKAVILRAENVAALSKLPLEGFIQAEGLDQKDASDKIWQDKAHFNKEMKEFQEKASLLAVAAHTGDKAEIKKAFMATAKTCKHCHDDFKKD